MPTLPPAVPTKVLPNVFMTLLLATNTGMLPATAALPALPPTDAVTRTERSLPSAREERFPLAAIRTLSPTLTLATRFATSTLTVAPIAAPPIEMPVDRMALVKSTSDFARRARFPSSAVRADPSPMMTSASDFVTCTPTAPPTAVPLVDAETAAMTEIRFSLSRALTERSSPAFI